MGKTVTKSDLVNELYDRVANVQERDCQEAVREMLNAITDTLMEGNRVEIRGFGCFGLKHRSGRRIPNPKNGAIMDISDRYAPFFKPGKAVRERVDEASLEIEK